MATADNSRSRVIAWLKILLPLLALAILSTLFLVAETLDPESAIPYAERGEIEDLIEEQRIGAPSFSVVIEDGTAIVVAADSARPDLEAESRLISRDLRAEFKLPDGKIVDIDSPDGVIDARERRATLTGGARLEGSDGTLVQTDTITASFDGGTAESGGPVTAEGPVGRLTAGHMSLARGDDGSYLLRFTDGVRLLYEPPTKE